MNIFTDRKCLKMWENFEQLLSKKNFNFENGCNNYSTTLNFFKYKCRL